MTRPLPEQFEEFSQARRNGFLKVKAVKDAGGRVAGTFCTFTPLEILDAAGFLPVSLCGMSAETIPAAEAELAKELGVPFLALETDYSELDLGQLSTRIEAFLEML